MSVDIMYPEKAFESAERPRGVNNESLKICRNLYNLSPQPFQKKYGQSL